MPTGADLRRAILGLVDQLNSYVPRTFTVASATSTSITSNDLSELPDDPTLLKGGYVRKPDGQVRLVQDFDSGTGTVTLNNGTIPTAGQVVEFSREWHPAQVDSAITAAYNEIKKKMWIADERVWATRATGSHIFKLPTDFAGISQIQYAGSAQNTPATLTGYLALTSTRTASYTPTVDVWLRYLSVTLKGPASSDVTVSIVGVTGASGTVAAADIPTNPQPFVVDFGTAVLLSANTTYTVQVAAGTGASVGVDTNNAVVWSGFQEQGDWYELPNMLWALEPIRKLHLMDTQRNASVYNSTGYFLPYTQMVKLLGVRYPDAPDDDEELEVPWDWMLYKVAFNLMAPHFSQYSEEKEDDRARIWAANMTLAEQAILPWPAGTRKII